MHVIYAHFADGTPKAGCGAGAGAVLDLQHHRQIGTAGHSVELIISNSNPSPIYEQIAAQIKAAIMDGSLEPGEQLPSIRGLANSLRVSVITTKRAYSDLEAQGFIETVQGRGCFVTSGSGELLKEERLREIEEQLLSALEGAQLAGISLQELHEMLDVLAQSESSTL